MVPLSPMDTETESIGGETGLEEAADQSRTWQPNTAPKIKPIDRKQSRWIRLDVENLVGPEDKVRAIWAVTGRMDLSELRQRIRSRQGEVGQAAEDRSY